MSIRAALEKEHSKNQTLKIVKNIGADPARFAELIAIFLAGPYRITQRAAWPLSYCVEAHPELVVPHLSKLLAVMGQPDAPDAARRNIVRLLQFIDIPRRYHGKAATYCFALLADTQQPVAIRVFSMQVLANLSKYQPELQHELRLLIEDQLPFASAGFKARARTILPTLSVTRV